MNNVLVTYEEMNNTTEVNIYSLSRMFELLKLKYKIKKVTLVNAQDIEWAGICIGIRPNSPTSCFLSSMIRNYKKIYVTLLDDDIIKLPQQHPDSWRAKYSKVCIKNCNYIISYTNVPTKHC